MEDNVYIANKHFDYVTSTRGEHNLAKRYLVKCGLDPELINRWASVDSLRLRNPSASTSEPRASAFPSLPVDQVGQAQPDADDDEEEEEGDDEEDAVTAALERKIAYLKREIALMANERGEGASASGPSRTQKKQVAPPIPTGDKKTKRPSAARFPKPPKPRVRKPRRQAPASDKSRNRNRNRNRNKAAQGTVQQGENTRPAETYMGMAGEGVLPQHGIDERAFDKGMMARQGAGVHGTQDFVLDERSFDPDKHKHQTGHGQQQYATADNDHDARALDKDTAEQGTAFEEGMHSLMS